MRTWLVVTAVAGAATIGFFSLAILSMSKPTNEKVTAGVRPYFGPGSAGVVGAF
jgi:Na+/proline symporter